MPKKLSPTAKRLLSDAARSKIGTISPRGGGGWYGRNRERVARRLVEQGLFRPYPHDGEVEITDAGRAALAEVKD